MLCVVYSQLGLVASSPTGFELLSEFNGFVEFLAEQVVSCGTLSMRGTCFYILGLISLTQPGRAKLSYDVTIVLFPSSSLINRVGGFMQDIGLGVASEHVAWHFIAC